MRNIAYINNKYIPLERATISILDTGLLYGYGVFETARAYKGFVFKLENHLNRLYRSIKIARIKSKLNKSEIRNIIFKLIRLNRLKDAYIKIIVTGGRAQPGLPFSFSTDPSIIVYALPYNPPPGRFFTQGLKVMVSDNRYSEESGLAGHKTLNYMHNLLCRREAIQKGYDDALLINSKGFIGESTNSNIMLAKDGEILTPGIKNGILPGVTRNEVMSLASGFLKMKVKEADIKPRDLYRSEEVFLTNSLSGIMPVAQVGRRRIGKTVPGPVTKNLTRIYTRSIDKYTGRQRRVSGK